MTQICTENYVTSSYIYSPLIFTPFFSKKSSLTSGLLVGICTIIIIMLVWYLFNYAVAKNKLVSKEVYH